MLSGSLGLQSGFRINRQLKFEAAMQSEIKAMLEAGVTEESDATYGCPVQPVVKDDSESGYHFCIVVKDDSELAYHFCNDVSPINVTKPHPLPAISMILRSSRVAMFVHVQPCMCTLFF